VTNRGRTVLEVDLLGDPHQEVYAEIEKLAPHTSVTLHATIPPGRYAWKCEGTTDGTDTLSNWLRVTGRKVAGAHPYVPVNDSQLITATLAYRQAITGGLAQFATDVDQLDAAVHAGAGAGQLSQAQWLAADLQWERLGAAYDTFGTFGTAIAGRPNGLPGGVDDPHFTGLLRLEYGLWHGQPTSQLAPVADALDASVHQLQAAFPTLQTTPNTVALRTHEILENTLQFDLTGQDDYGSHTELAVAWANVQGTQTALGAIAPLLQLHSKRVLATVTAGLAHLATLLQGYQRPDGSWTPLTTLTTAQREQLNGVTGALLEQLAVVPDLLELPPTPAAAT